jgi:hypothetical protein
MKSAIPISICPGAGKNNDSRFHTTKNNGGALLPPSRHNLNPRSAYKPSEQQAILKLYR